MKKTLFFIVCAVIGLYFFSCKKKYNPIELEKLNISRDISLFDTVSSPSSTLTWSIEVPSLSQKENALVVNKVLIQAICDTQCDCPTIEDAMEYYAENYKLNFRSDNAYIETESKEIGKRLIELLDASFEDFRMETTYNDDGFFCFTLTKSSYSGGAHGMKFEKAYIVDEQKGELIGFYDIFENADAIQALLVETIVKKYGVQQYDDLYEYGFFGFSEFSMTENITLTKEGVTWIFNPYEIASYATGIIEVTIPYEDLDSYIGKTNPIKRLM